MLCPHAFVRFIFSFLRPCRRTYPDLNSLWLGRSTIERNVSWWTGRPVTTSHKKATTSLNVWTIDHENDNNDLVIDSVRIVAPHSCCCCRRPITTTTIVLERKSICIVADLDDILSINNNNIINNNNRVIQWQQQRVLGGWNGCSQQSGKCSRRNLTESLCAA